MALTVIKRQQYRRRLLRPDVSFIGFVLGSIATVVFFLAGTVAKSSAFLPPPPASLFSSFMACDRPRRWQPSISSRSLSFPVLPTVPPCTQRAASPGSPPTAVAGMSSAGRRRGRQEPPAPSLAAAPASSPEASQRKSGSKLEQSNQVLYQKVVRPPPARALSSSPSLFLGCLVEYLSERFELPPRLPMVYRRVDLDVESSADGRMDRSERGESTSALDSADDRDERLGSVVSWDSPLSPSSDLTRIDVQVVGIYARDDDPVPTLALVAAVRPNSKQLSESPEARRPRQEPTDRRMPVLLRNLFAESERQILESLDRGLQDFESGRLPLSSWVAQQERGRQSFEEARESMVDELGTMLSERERELLAGSPLSLSSTQQRRKVLDAVVVRDGNGDDDEAMKKTLPEEKESSSLLAKPDRTNAVVTSRNAPASASRTRAQESKATIGTSDTEVDPSVTTTTSGLDFAVRAARDAAKRRQQRLQQRQKPDVQQEEDFAVEAARNASKAGTTKRLHSSRAPKLRSSSDSSSGDASGAAPSPTKSSGGESDLASPQGLDLTRIRPALLDPANSSPRAFFTSISNPRDYRGKSGDGKTEQGSTRSDSISRTHQPPAFRVQVDDQETESTTSEGSPTARERKAKRKLNLVLKQSKGGDDDDGGPKRTLGGETDVGTDDEQLQATKEAMDELGAGADMTVDELLRSIIEFGKDQENSEGRDGRGFVSGAMGMAKELLRAQKLKRISKLQAEDTTPNALSESQVEEELHQSLGFKEVLSPDEEIRRMFEAGERLAEGRIAVASSQDIARQRQMKWSEEDARRVDTLLAKDKSISSYARRLDDELAELEVQVNRSPDELVEAPSLTKKNPIFDVLSGPEVYDPNVDPEKSVNWPGALPGTRDALKLPRELEEAVRQAEFAASVLSKVEERRREKMPEGESTPSVSYFVGGRELTHDQIVNLQLVVKEAVETGLIEDPFVIATERSRLQMLLDELWNQPAERIRDVSSSFKDLLLSKNFIQLMRERLSRMAERDIEALRRNDDSLEEAHARERELLGTLIAYAKLLLKEAHALGAELEAQHLEVIRSICKVAMDPRYSTEEESAEALTDSVRGMRPLFDDAFVAYLKYAVAEEEGRLARAGVLDDPEHNQWLMVLKIVQQGVYRELERGISRYIDHIWYVLRMETPTERRLLLQKLIDAMPTLDVRPFVQVVESIVGSLGDSASGEFDGAYTLGQMTNKLLQLRRDVRELLPPERIALMSRDADKWAARQKDRLLEQRRQTKHLMEAARQTEHLDNEIEALGRRGEAERIE